MRILILLALVVGGTAHAGAWNCDQIAAAAKQDAIGKGDVEVDTNALPALWANIFRQTLSIGGGLSAEEAAAADLVKMADEYQVIFDTYTIDGKTLNAVNIDMGDNAFIYLFDGESYANVKQEDGSVSVDGAYCMDVDMDVF